MSPGDVVFAVILAILVIAVLALRRTIDERFAEIRPALQLVQRFS